MISILLSCYNSNLDYLKQQIDSIVFQTEQDWELLVYNDGCSDLEQFLDNLYQTLMGKKIFYYCVTHLGIVGSFNYLFPRANGEYICICDHDDIWELDKLAVEKQYLDEHKDVDCVFGWLKWFGEKNKVEEFHISDEDISNELVFWQPIKNPTVMFRKSRFGLNSAPFDLAADFWYWSHNRDRHYHLIEKVLVNYRRHAGEATKDRSLLRLNSAMVIQDNLIRIFDVFPMIELCKTMDRYSKEYNPYLVDFMKDLIERKTNDRH